MAHAAVIGSLLEQLVKVTSKTSSGAQLEQRKNLILHDFGSSKAGRTNPFNVNARLDGLVEKARILNNDPLANALLARLTELSSRSDTWTPEVLSLLLQLSDRPVQNTKVEDLLLLKPHSPAASLTWADIVADDPLDDQDDLWKNVEFSGDPSDEDEDIRAYESDSPESTPCSSVLNREIVENKIERLTLPGSADRLLEIEDAQFWHQEGILVEEKKQPKLLLTELHVIREIVFMLLGLPNAICTTDAVGRIQMRPNFAMRQLSETGLADLLQGFTNIEDKLATVRRWTKSHSHVPLEQTFQAAIISRLANLESTFHTIQARILCPQSQFAPSLMRLDHEVNKNSRLILQVYDVVKDLELTPKSEVPFALLERCFDRTCVNQSMGDVDGYEWMAKLFFQCFQTYLRPIQHWMEKGQLNRHDSVMFIKQSEEDVPLACLWQKQYHLVKTDTAELYAPKFLQMATKKILDTGKSVDFLRQLNYQVDKMGSIALLRPDLTFDAVCRPADFGMLSPFSELFDEAIDGWITNQHCSASSVLRMRLDTECGLQRSLDAIELIYFCRNGAVSSKILVKIFENIDQGDRRWNDNFVVTESLQVAFNDFACIDVNDLEVRSHKASRKAGRSMSVLGDLRVHYTLSWPIANIIKAESMEVYQRIFTFVAQIHRAQYLLQRHTFSKRASVSDGRSLLLIHRLHHQLLWFVNTILAYTTDIVLSASTTDMRTNIRGTEDVDSLIRVHEQYISQLQDRCLLTKQHEPIRQAVISLLDLTVLLSDMQASDARQASLEDKRVSKGTKPNRNGETYVERRIQAQRAPDHDDDSDDCAHKADASLISSTRTSDVEKLRGMCHTFNKIHSFVTAAVQGLSKADNTACWEILANSLAADLRE